jgi:hypothetical protein
MTCCNFAAVYFKKFTIRLWVDLTRAHPAASGRHTTVPMCKPALRTFFVDHYFYEQRGFHLEQIARPQQGCEQILCKCL